MKFSIITTVLNENKNIGNLLSSIKEQYIQPKEFIIVDGGSTDGTIEQIKEFQESYGLIKLIIDPTCRLKHSVSPIAKGRNVAIANTTTDLILCCDAGCSYDPDWTRLFLEALKDNDYCFGGSAVRLKDATFWDILFSVFVGYSIAGFGFKNFPIGTARAIAFKKKVWQEVGGFPEITLMGEDTMYFIKLQSGYKGTFVPAASAKYKPGFSFASAVKRIYMYVHTDGFLRISSSRALRMLIRMLAILYLICLIVQQSFDSLLLYLILIAEIFFAFRIDLKGLIANRLFSYLIPRFFLSLSIPFIYTYSYFRGLLFGISTANDQNIQGNNS